LTELPRKGSATNPTIFPDARPDAIRGGSESIPLNKPSLAGNEIAYIREAIASRHLSGDGSFTRKCHAWLEQTTGCTKALLTHSCTGALEMSAMLIDLVLGDEVIMPSFTFVSTANAVVLRGAIPVFVDIRPDTLNINETLIEAAITPRTRAIFVVHYAGVACAMDEIMAIARKYGLYVVEDAAQGIAATYRGRPLGSIGHLGALSFHETKNVISGEGGALLINDASFIDRAQILREKGTNRAAFFEGRVDKYRWVDFGSSYLPGEIVAAFLYAQLEAINAIQDSRQESWNLYHELFADAEAASLLRRPTIPPMCRANGHIYYVIVNSAEARVAILRRLKEQGIGAAFHYVPLHDAPAGRKFARIHGSMQVTEDLSARLVRTPLWAGMSEDVVTTVAASIKAEAHSMQTR
jgi:dTDP-4-amino-4,6-dideoxygalactose transaminase